MAVHNFKDLTNEPPFGRLTVIERGPDSANGRDQWWCVCECKNKVLVKGYDLQRGHNRSCGCLAADKARQRNTRHGQYGTPEYRTWIAMLARCYNPHRVQFPYYGGRGITVCDTWRKDFSQFYADMGPRPSPKHTIERRSNDGIYEPSNCFWGTQTQQVRNRSNTVFVIYEGTRMSLPEAAERAEMSYGYADHLYRKYGWPESGHIPHEQIRVLYKGKYLSLTEAAEHAGIPYAKACRLHRKYDWPASDYPLPTQLRVIYNGETLPLAEAARRAGIPYMKAWKHFKKHGHIDLNESHVTP